MKQLEYGLIKEFENGTTLWYERVTDILDAFVLRGPDGYIIDMWE